MLTPPLHPDLGIRGYSYYSGLAYGHMLAEISVNAFYYSRPTPASVTFLYK